MEVVGLVGAVGTSAFGIYLVFTGVKLMRERYGKGR